MTKRERLVKKAESGDAEAQYALGEHLWCKTPIDKMAAVACFRKAAKAGLAEAQCALACAFMCGEGVRKNWREAYRWYRTAAENGESWACYLLGLCYRDGEGVKKSMRWARHWWLKSGIENLEE